ncbi:UDP-N-acetylglucosamine--LPS N-acetylglucosamine transferase [Falsiphaeobacter marinintestinus]|uniref:UDP-N-acetylglucosamine--LPS N-acetylglucosamine transferase n=1 Tax=Falsiphaeobacter marinintestinus TaxID=1492905 RepID=UPI0011B786F4|nr:UDP-N-acetylglucosamine--LPS N-acetylglucosamine transferase [Phaeobacter marinintestinus]
MKRKINTAKKHRVLAVASGGGHWVQLLRLRPAFANSNVHFATVDPKAKAQVAPAPFYTFKDANRDTKLKLMLSALQIAVIVLRVRPHVVISTGAAPGYLAIRMAKLIGARTMFIDSIANANELSLSAHLAKRHADKLVTQWPSVAEKTGANFIGSVL